jgi:glycosyltransferase involved in cell wall biosynthesis
MSTPRPDRDELPHVVVMWESFGPTHHDRVRALARAGFDVDAIELSSVSRDYVWERDAAAEYRMHTLAAKPVGRTSPVLAWRLLRACLRTGARHIFLCHYNRPEVLAAAVMLRLRGRRVYSMMESKFDDYPRSVWRELGKSLFLVPYNGALAASRRCRDYTAFLGLPRDRIELGYSAVDVARLAAAAAQAARDEPFVTRPFLVVARLVPKKNIARILEAFARYRAGGQDLRELHIVGYGPLREELEAEASRLGIAEAVKFLGAQDIGEVAKAMAGAAALILASTEEQFGLVVIEALAAGLPVIVSSNAGAADALVRNLDNGLVIDPYDVESIMLAMAHIGGSEASWRAMHDRALATAMGADASRFAEGVGRLVRRV